MSYQTTDFGMFSHAGNCAVAEIVREARELAGVDGPVNPVQQAINYMLNELEYLGKEHFEEADDTAVREAAMAEFFKEDA
jgi:hypothetical protein